jgi:hypothetical protein
VSRRAALLLALAGCGFAQRHPAITAGIVGGVVGGLSCEIDNPAKQAYCGLIAGGAAAFLGGITGLVTLFADTSDHELPPVDDEDDGDEVRVHTSTPPPPVTLDAGVDAPLAADAAPDGG